MSSPLLDYMYEIRWRLVYMGSGYGYALCMAWWHRETYVYFYGFLCRRLGLPLVALDMGESLGVYLHITIYIACLSWFLLGAYHLWCFLAPGLYAYEARRWLWMWCRWALYSLCLYMVGLYYLWPELGGYLLTLSPMEGAWGRGIVHLPRAHSYIYWALYTPLVVVVCGCIPYALVLYGLPLGRWRALWIWCSALGVSLLVPPSPLFQCGLTCVLWGVYEGTVLYMCVSQSRVKR